MTLAPSPLLSAEESRRAARPLRGWSEDDQALLAGALQALLDQWRGAWGLVAPAEGGRVEIRSCPVEDGAWGASSWFPLDESGAESVVLWSLRGNTAGTGLAAVPLRRPRPALDALHEALFHEPPGAEAGPERLADRLLRAAWADWNKRLAGLLPAEGGTAPSGSEAAALIRRPWSGALVASLPWCGRDMALLLTTDLVSSLLARQRGRAPAARPADQTPLVPLFQVLKGEGVALRIELAEMEVDLGTLAGLRQGDVLRTSHRLDAPLLLTGPGEAKRVIRCIGHLGRQGEWRAIELLPHGAPAGNGTAS
jgi:hypothetical protein